MISSLPLPTFTVQDPMNIWRRIAMPPHIAQDVFNVTVKTRFKWDTRRLTKQFDAATRRSLMLAGKDVRAGIRGVMSSRRPLGTERLWRLGNHNGQNLIALVRRVPKGGGIVTSWKTKSFPEGFLKKSILSDWDYSSKSVVAGPSKGHAVADLQNMGGTSTFSFVPAVKSQQRKTIGKHSTVYGRIVTGRRDTSLWTFRRKLADLRFVEKGRDKAVAKKATAKHFANQMNGP
jgi:hypothetical protein